MTSVVAWRARETLTFGKGPASVMLQDIWLAADSLITAPINGASRATLTGAAAKIIPIPVRLYQGYENGPGYHPIYEGQLGFAFAGSTFSATMTQSLVMSCLGSLCGEIDDALPTMDDLAAFICRVGTRYITDSAAPFEACVIGADCDRRGLAQTRCFHLTYDPKILGMVATEVDLDPPGAFVLLGDRKADVSKLITSGFAANAEYSPSQALAQTISDSGYPSIGGALQLGRANRGWFKLLPTWGYSGSVQTFPSALGLGSDGGLGDVGSFFVGDP